MMGESRLTYIILSLMVFGSVIFGFYSLVNGMADANAYNIDIDDKSVTFHQTETISKELNKSYSSLQTERPSLTAQFFTGISAGFNIIRTLMTGLFNIAGAFLADVVNIIGLPDWFFLLGIGVMTLLITMAVIGWIKNREP